MTNKRKYWIDALFFPKRYKQRIDRMINSKISDERVKLIEQYTEEFTDKVRWLQKDSYHSGLVNQKHELPILEIPIIGCDQFRKYGVNSRLLGESETKCVKKLDVSFGCPAYTDLIKRNAADAIADKIVELDMIHARFNRHDNIITLFVNYFKS